LVQATDRFGLHAADGRYPAIASASRLRPICPTRKAKAIKLNIHTPKPDLNEPNPPRLLATKIFRADLFACTSVSSPQSVADLTIASIWAQLQQSGCWRRILGSQHGVHSTRVRTESRIPFPTDSMKVLTGFPCPLVNRPICMNLNSG